MNQQRDDEVIAKEIVKRVMAIQLRHADTHGGVDYLSTDGTAALEVTAVTNGEREGARKALSKSKAKGSPTELQDCWLVTVSDTQQQMKTFVQRVQPAIAALELAGGSYFDKYKATAHVLEMGGLSQVYRPLLEAGVKRAVPFPPHSPDDLDHLHRIVVLPGSGGSVAGSDEAFGLLMKELKKKRDNPAKLRASGAEQRHLFVWLDDNTWYNIGRPLSREAPSWAVEGWGLPKIEPQLDPAITHLWVVHYRSRIGWLWDGKGWRELRDI